MRTVKEMLTEGLIPKKEWNELVKEVRTLANMEVGRGLAFRKGAKYLLTLTERPTPKLTFSLSGLLTEVATNVCDSLRLIDPITITNIIAYVEVQSSSGSINIDVNVHSDPGGGGTSLYPSAPKPSIAASTYADLDSIPDTRNIEAGQYINIDLDAVGTGAEGLTVIIFGK